MKRKMVVLFLILPILKPTTLVEFHNEKLPPEEMKP